MIAHHCSASAVAALLGLALATLPASAGVQPPVPAQPAAGGVAATTFSQVFPDTAAARDAVYPALVNITVVGERYAGGRTLRYPAAGSGVIVKPEGYVLTNYHVAGDSTRIECTLTTGEVLEAEVVVNDPLTDLSVLKIHAAHPLPFAELGDSDRLEVGEPVLAMGNPLALSSSVTRGIVSNPHRVFTDFLGSTLTELDLEDGQPTGMFTRWIQHDALILPGNSGGPLVNLRGQVVGINELGGSGIGFAIPSNMAAAVLRQSVAHGEVRRGWLGLSVLPVEKLGRESGALVSDVLTGSPAERAGVRPGDLLLSLAGEPVVVRFLEQIPLLYQRIAALPVGETVDLTLQRDGETLDLHAEVERMEPALGKQGEIEELGLTVREITAPMALVHRYPTSRGLVVTGVRPGFAAETAKPPVTAGDVLLALAGKPITGIADLNRQLEAVRDKPEVAVRYWSSGQELVTVLRLEPPDEHQWGGELPQGWLGARTQVVTPDLATALGIPGTQGFRVTEVIPWSTAASAGLEVGDVVTALDGEALDASRLQDREDLRRAIERRAPGDEVRLTVLRDGESREIGFTLQAKPEDPSRAQKIAWDELNFKVRQLTDTDRIDRRWDRSVEGVLVAEVPPGGWAQMAGLQLGDLILAINGSEVPSMERFAAVRQRLLDERPPVVRIFLRRDYRTHFVFIEPDWSSIAPAPDRTATDR